jgi:hypothetical protein
MMPTQIPNEQAQSVLVGKTLCVSEEMYTRGGQSGLVVEAFDGGVALDFFCDVFGDRWGLPSIEFWEWTELDQEYLHNVLEGLM